MRRVLQRFPSLVARNSLNSPTNFRLLNTNHRLVPSLERCRTISRFAFFSSESNPARGPISDEVVSKEELKKRIKRFLDDGDEDALPFLFAALMDRKLTGKHDESDDEVMEEVRKYPINDAHQEEAHVTDSDVESDGGLMSGGGSSDSDIESDDDALSGTDSSDSEIESDDVLTDGESSDLDFGSDDALRYGDSSESDMESDDGLRDSDSSESDSDSD
ncbi:unnamed protein product [Microthlaspi erraticum]|uniref:Uncharacterized protein n=1 Tax=Microthlaspi erraticum TaxID=1685480 RepID=A0A6D2JND1_9BRAS|nr:unnamed protein product [Microthlaspi erraticum]